jgi:hypothetical protein
MATLNNQRVLSSTDPPPRQLDVDLSHLAQEFLEIQRPFQLVMPSEKKTSSSLKQQSMDWFKGKFTGKPHI